MSRRPLLHWLPTVLLIAASAGAQTATATSLTDLAKIAKARADRQRPALEKKLEPFLEDLQINAKDNWDKVHSAVVEAARLGDTITPLLLEKLTPASGNPAHRNLARNCSRVLVRLKPETFVDTLMDIAANHANYAAQGHAIYLLGKTGSERSGALLTQLFLKSGKDRNRRNALLEALIELAYKPAAVHATTMLPATKTREHDLVFGLLNATSNPAAGNPVLKARLLEILPKVRKPSRIMDYVRVLQKVARRDAATAKVLLPYLKGETLDRIEMSELCTALATIAPEGDATTVSKLQALLEGGGTGDLELQAAVTLRALGNKTGPRTLLNNLRKKLKGTKKRDPYNHSNLGDYYMAFAEHQKAIRSFKEGLRYATGRNLQIMLQIRIARSEAHRSRWPIVRKYLVATGYSKKQLLDLADRHKELAEAYKQPVLKKFLEGLKR